MISTFAWDMLVNGGTDETIKEQLKNLQKKTGSVFGHNEKVTLEAKAPDIQAAQAAEGARIFRNHIMGRFGYPEHWYGGGGDVNRATASEMDLPAMKMLSNKQLYVKYVLEFILGYQVMQARNAGYLKRSDEAFSIVTPAIQPKDIAKYGATVQQVATALQQAEMQQWVDKDTARKLFATIMGFIGVDIDLEEVKTAVEQQMVTAGYEDYLKDKKVVNSTLRVACSKR